MIHHRHSLKPNSKWLAQGYGHPLAETVRVEGIVSLDFEILRVQWLVQEPAECFRIEVHTDQGPIWQDSCVELFLSCYGKERPVSYLNLECNALGKCLVARGPDREKRHPLSPQEIQTIRRQADYQKKADRISWSITVELPLILTGWSFDQLQAHPDQLIGNLQKCSDLSQAPHWLTAFPIPTPSPDFHRPEYFQPLLQY